MSFAAIGLALALQGASTHASLHPADVDVFLEVPDLPALIAAYDQVPTFRLLRDDNVLLSIQELTGEEFDLDAQMDMAFRSMLSPEAMGLLQSVQALSLSLQVPARNADGSAPPPSFTFIVDFGGEEQARAVLAVMIDEASSSQPHPNSPLEGTVTLQIDELAGLPLWAVVQGPRLVLAGGALQPSHLALRMAAGDGAGLAGEAAYADARDQLEAKTGATVFQGFTARSPLSFLSAFNLPPEMAQAMAGLGELSEGMQDFLGGKRCWRMQLVEGRFLTEMVALDEPATSAAKPSMLGGRPLDPRWLEPVDPEAMFVFSAALDGQALLVGVQEGLQEFGRQTGQSMDLASIEGELGIPLGEIFGQLGPGLAVYAKPLRGVAIPETYAWIELGDPATFLAHVTSLSENLGTKFPGFSLRTRDYRVKDKASGERMTFPITSLTIPPELIELPPGLSMSPAFTVAEGMLLMSLSPMHLKRELRRLYSGDKDPIAAGSEPVDPLAAWGAAYPPSARSVIVMDWGSLIGGLVSMAKSLGPYIGSIFPMPFDAQALPEPETITQYYRPTVHYSRRLEGATYRRHEASFGPEIWLGAIVAGLQVYQQMSRELSAVSVSPPPVPVDPKPEGGDDGQILATKMALQKIRTRIAVYKLEFKVVPPTLATLVQPTDAYPDGFLDQKEVPKDGWGRSFRYEPTADNLEYALWSFGPDGIDDGGEADDIRSK